eukprot:gene15129-16685_t
MKQLTLIIVVLLLFAHVALIQCSWGWGKKNSKDSHKYDDHNAKNCDKIYIVILSSSSLKGDDLKKVITKLSIPGSNVLERKIILGEENLMDDKKKSEKVVEKLVKKSPTILLFLLPKEVGGFFKGSVSIQLRDQNTKGGVNLSTRIIADSVKNKKEIRSNLIVVLLSKEVDKATSDLLKGLSVLNLDFSSQDWEKDLEISMKKKKSECELKNRKMEM